LLFEALGEALNDDNLGTFEWADSEVRLSGNSATGGDAPQGIFPLSSRTPGAIRNVMGCEGDENIVLDGYYDDEEDYKDYENYEPLVEGRTVLANVLGVGTPSWAEDLPTKIEYLWRCSHDLRTAFERVVMLGINFLRHRNHLEKTSAAVLL